MRNSKALTYSTALGVLTTFGFAPFHMTVIAIVSLSIMYLLILSHKKSASFSIGLWFGIGYFCTTLYWFAFALATDLIAFGWLIPFAIFGLSFFFSLYFAFAFLIFRLLKFQNPITFGIVLTFFEWLRGYLFTGFPWNLLGYAWSSLEILQSTAFIGIYGLTFITSFVAGSIGAMIHKNNNVNILYCSTSAFLIVAMLAGGAIRLQYSKYSLSDINIRVVQANISHQANWNKEYGIDTISKYIDLTNSSDISNIDYVIWPESSVPYLLALESNNIAEYLYSNVTKTIIAGGERIEDNKIFNTMFVFDKGKISSHYDKQKLVPFGEYVPFRQFIPFKKIVSGMHDFSSGTNKVIDYLKLIPTICYEDIFPDIVQNKNAKWIVNLTNDSWFGLSTEPYQHFHMARVRSIESGLPLVRSTTTGISGVFDGNGRILKAINVSRSGIIDVNIPNEITGGTIYSRFHKEINYLIVISGIMLSLLAIFSPVKH